MLSLQLRSTVQDAIDAEAAADAIDVDGALWQLRSRLTPLIDERRRALEDEVARERTRGAEAIADAHAEAERITIAAIEAAAARAMAARAATELARRSAELEAIAQPPAAAPPPLFDQTQSSGPGADEATTPGEFVAAAESATLPPPLPPPMPGSGLLSPGTTPDTLVLLEVEPSSDDVWARTMDRPDRTEAPPTMQLVLDADSFARAFAAAMAPILEAREQQPQYVLPPAAYLQPQAPPPKRSFWAHAWHPDVLLSGLAMVIVIIVLVAWTG